MLKGKQGRFRQNLLGKRVDYSGRSVIVVGPELKLHQCGLPTKMALELYKPFIMKKLVEKDVVYNIKKAKTLVEMETPEVWAVLEEVVSEHPVLLNRAPTLHRLGIQAFEPVLVEGKAIRLHPLVCHAFNADFDGDQMAVHVPLTPAAQIECWTLMLSSRNLLNPANGNPIVIPTQDMVLGINYLTRVREGAKGTGKYFASVEEVLLALDARSVEYQALIKLKREGKYLETTPGRIILNEELPKELGFLNESMGEKELRALISRIYTEHGADVTVKMLDVIKDLGFKYATRFGATIGMEDVIIPSAKRELIGKANTQVEEIQNQYLQGHITNEERYNRVVEVWSTTNELITNELMNELKKDRGGFNPVYMMAHSGARGSRTQIRQLGGMRGLMAKPSGDIIELPIRSNFKEGLSVIEFFISTNGARKGLADTALKTADAGYLTRRLVDIAQDVVINEEDCGTINGLDRRALKDGEEVVESLRDRIVGRFTLERVRHPITGEVIVDVNQEITDELADQIEAVGIESVRVRTVLTCEAKHGVCVKCYGRNLATNRRVEIGEAVGIIAAQSIGQPGHAAHHEDLPHRRGGHQDQRGEPRLPALPGAGGGGQGQHGGAEEREPAVHPQGAHPGPPHPAQLRPGKGRPGGGAGRPARAFRRPPDHPQGRAPRGPGDRLRAAHQGEAAADRPERSARTSATGRSCWPRIGHHRPGRGDHRLLRPVLRADHRRAERHGGLRGHHPGHHAQGGDQRGHREDREEDHRFHPGDPAAAPADQEPPGARSWPPITCRAAPT